MFSHHHHAGRGGCSPQGGRDKWDRWYEHFAARWEEAQRGSRVGRGGNWFDADGEFVGRARGRRMFDGGELRLVLLELIARETRHGYELIRAIEEMTGGAYAPSPGVVYPTLSMLDEMGLIAEQQSDDAKKRFAVTDAGTRHLAENREAVDALMARLESVGAHRQRTDRAPLRRAMGNLRVALQNRVAHGEFSDETLHDVVALIDEVAQKIERLR